MISMCNENDMMVANYLKCDNKQLGGAYLSGTHNGFQRYNSVWLSTSAERY